jgi:hypothetical protein
MEWQCWWKEAPRNTRILLHPARRRLWGSVIVISYRRQGKARCWEGRGVVVFMRAHRRARVLESVVYDIIESGECTNSAERCMISLFGRCSGHRWFVGISGSFLCPSMRKALIRWDRPFIHISTSTGYVPSSYTSKLGLLPLRADPSIHPIPILSSDWKRGCLGSGIRGAESLFSL